VEDVAAVVDSRPGPVFLLGHSYGGVAALEAAFLTRIDLAVVQRIEALIQAGQGEPAVAINSLNASRPQATLTVLAGQQHSAMDSGRPQLDTRYRHAGSRTEWI
jgi:pimeloyl-ACP methyl ester carboxylesterase